MSPSKGVKAQFRSFECSPLSISTSPQSDAHLIRRHFFFRCFSHSYICLCARVVVAKKKETTSIFKLASGSVFHIFRKVAPQFSLLIHATRYFVQLRKKKKKKKGGGRENALWIDSTGRAAGNLRNRGLSSFRRAVLREPDVSKQTTLLLSTADVQQPDVVSGALQSTLFNG
mmetsp:Transcript_2545/g.6914  ORF Transcript_2545/g.6914 Transcript_2545/m.6914 type:complete len:172 (+) Transcript_2545:1708-2223(+)